jgi:hypothetical protein
MGFPVFLQHFQLLLDNFQLKLQLANLLLVFLLSIFHFFNVLQQLLNFRNMGDSIQFKHRYHLINSLNEPVGFHLLLG